MSVMFLCPMFTSLVEQLTVAVRAIVTLYPVGQLDPTGTRLSVSGLIVLGPLCSGTSVLSFYFKSTGKVQDSHPYKPGGPPTTVIAPHAVSFFTAQSVGSSLTSVA